MKWILGDEKVVNGYFRQGRNTLASRRVGKRIVKIVEQQSLQYLSFLGDNLNLGGA